MTVSSRIKGISMNSVNKTLYIPLYGKSYVSKKGIILNDSKAEEIWAAEGFKLRGKSKSKWLAYYMGMRSRVFDNWVTEKINQVTDATVIHIGCGMDSRIERVGGINSAWYDVDFPEVIKERRRYYQESDTYKMIEGDAREANWLKQIPNTTNAIIIMEGVSMYLREEELRLLFTNLSKHFDRLDILMDCYTVLAAKMSKYKNPINDVGVTRVYGTDDPKLFENSTSLSFVKEHSITPDSLVNELTGLAKSIFKLVYGGGISKKLYKLYEYEKI